ncbi:MAG: type II toxin-antitoxin system RelE/ParE family toxin [Rhodospirillaceae bacterium]|nr:type II toxin-antitoxin system RelE/ParE family toxin [Rhodospirillaceae bacterium]MCY4310678.1 type II toxin-antitoxin system RelE/ParE family toxin [Rhodospirillaceae bacterium]
MQLKKLAVPDMLEVAAYVCPDSAMPAAGHFACREGIDDTTLFDSVARIVTGLADADLGSDVFKQCIAPGSTFDGPN